VFNGAAGSTGCSAPPSTLPANIGPGDGTYNLTADRVNLNGQSNPSTTFVYILDTKAPLAPGTVTTTQLANDGIRVRWSKASDDTTSPGVSGVTKYNVFRSAPDQADPTVEGTYTKIGTVNDSACTGASGLECTYDDIALGEEFDPVTGKHYFYKVSSVDLAGNEGAKSNSSPGAAPGIEAVIVAPVTIVSMGGSTTSPTFQPDATQTKPDVVVSVGTDSGTVTLKRDGVNIATKTVPTSATEVTIQAANYLTGQSALPRSHSYTAEQTVGTDHSPASNTFTYVLPPARPTITSVAGDTTSPAKDDVTQPSVAVSWVGAATNDTVKLFVDDDCTGPHAKVQVGQKTGVSGTTTTFNGVAGDWGSTQLAKGQSYCLTVTNTDTTISDAPTATSPSSTPFTFERAPIISGYLLDGQGGIHEFGGAPKAAFAPYYGFDIGRRISVMPDGKTGYELDGYGGIHPFATGTNSKPATVVGAPYFGFDIARDLIITGVGKGYVLDGFGGIHAFGGATPVTSGPYFAGHDVARRFVLLPNGKGGYLLDGFGGVHGFGIGVDPRPANPSGSPYFGFDIARGLQLYSPTAGYVLDGYGGVHPFGNAPSVTFVKYTANFDIARDLDTTEVDLNGGYVLDGNGQVTAWGDAVSIPRPAVFPPDIARDLVLFTS
jgi:hypothetical protein